MISFVHFVVPWLLACLASGSQCGGALALNGEEMKGTQGDRCNEIDPNGESEAVGVNLLQSHLAIVPAHRAVEDGCDRFEEVFAQQVGHPWQDVGSGNHLANIDPITGEDRTGTNPRQTSFCNRTKAIFDDVQQTMQQQLNCCQWSVKPTRILSVGCSIGIEAREARGRYPDAEIVGFDINEPVIALAKAKWDPALNMRFTSNKSEVPLKYFDLILVNNVLVESTPKSDFLSFVDEWRNWLREDGGLLEIQIFSTFELDDGSSWKDLLINTAKNPYHHLPHGPVSFWFEHSPN